MARLLLDPDPRRSMCRRAWAPDRGLQLKRKLAHVGRGNVTHPPVMHEQDELHAGWSASAQGPSLSLIWATRTPHGRVADVGPPGSSGKPPTPETSGTSRYWVFMRASGVAAPGSGLLAGPQPNPCTDLHSDVVLVSRGANDKVGYAAASLRYRRRLCRAHRAAVQQGQLQHGTKTSNQDGPSRQPPSRAGPLRRTMTLHEHGMLGSENYVPVWPHHRLRNFKMPHRVNIICGPVHAISSDGNASAKWAWEAGVVREQRPVASSVPPMSVSGEREVLRTRTRRQSDSLGGWKATAAASITRVGSALSVVQGDERLAGGHHNVGWSRGTTADARTGEDCTALRYPAGHSDAGGRSRYLTLRPSTRDQNLACRVASVAG